MASALSNLSDFNPAEVPSGKDYKFAIVVAEWNQQITENLFLGATEALMACGVEEQHIFRSNVPGSFELVFGAKKALEQQVDAVIVIGSVIQGETKHFDFICQGVTRGIVSLNLRSNRPVVFLRFNR
jgi:6,7-dimethyl-8-ribityllumazine synthase